MGLPRHFHDEANRHTRIFVCTAERIHDKETLVAELTNRNLAYSIPRFLRRAMVVVLVLVGGPPDRIMRGLIVDDVLILRGASRIDARHDVDSILHLRHLSTLISLKVRAQLLTKQLIVAWIVNNLRCPRNAVLCQINRCHDITSFSNNRLGSIDNCTV